MSKMNFSRTGRAVGQIFRCALIGALALLLVAAPALAAAPLTGTFAGTATGQKVAFTHAGKQRNDFAGVLKLKLDNGPTIPVFCIQIDVQVRPGDRYRSDGAVLALVNGCQIRYLLDHYPASTASTANEAAARQLAIWVFSDGLDPAGIGDATLRDRTTALVNEAKKGACPERRTEGPDLTIEPPVGNGPAGRPIAYTVRAGPADAGQPITLAVAAPAVLLDAQGQPVGQQIQLTLDQQGAAMFRVLSASNGQMRVTADLPYRLEAGTVFSQIDSSTPTQRLVMAERQNLVAHAEAQASFSGSAPTPAGPTATPGAVTVTPGGATATPKKATATPKKATATPETATAIAPTPSASASSETPTTGAQGAASTPEQATPAAASPTSALAAGSAQSTPAVSPAGGQAGAASSSGRPRSLPNTGSSSAPNLPLLAIVAALCLGGWLLRRHGRADH